MKALWFLPLLASLLLPTNRASALPLEPDYPCYLRTTTGRVIDLTASLCGGSGKAAAIPTTQTSDRPALALTSRQTKFVADYRQLASVEANRAVAVALTGMIANEPQKEISAAGAACLEKAYRRAGIRIARSPQPDSDSLKHAIAISRSNIIDRLTDRAYCAG